MKIKNGLQFGIGFAALVALGGAAFYGISQYRHRKSPEYALMRQYQKLQEAYQADTYGGDTPEETLRLFIDALKKGDIDLASKYFVVDEWEKERVVLEQVGGSNKLTEVIARLQKFKISKQDGPSASFVILDDGGILKYQVSFTKNQNGKWKILEL